ncbi:hypothetical protein [Haloarcula sp. CGMCC 1.6347]|uniref:hypothetical protein n=1 Tax=Haloarcula sp. CGMCC 1.6347 TaxID=3111455 RepID=UPI00300F469F
MASKYEDPVSMDWITFLSICTVVIGWPAIQPVSIEPSSIEPLLWIFWGVFTLLFVAYLALPRPESDGQ